MIWILASDVSENQKSYDACFCEVCNVAKELWKNFITLGWLIVMCEFNLQRNAPDNNLCLNYTIEIDPWFFVQMNSIYYKKLKKLIIRIQFITKNK